MNPKPVVFFKRKLINACFTMAMIILLILVWLTYRNLRQTQTSDTWSKHTYIVIQEFDRLLSDLKDLETGQRGFIITGNIQYLDPYYKAISHINERQDSLGKLTKDNPKQKERLRQLAGLIDEKLKEINQTIELRKGKGFAATLEHENTNFGKRTMDKIRSQVSDCENEEEHLLQIRNEIKIVEFKNMTRTMIIGTLISFIFLILVFYLLTHEINIHLVSERDLKKRTEELDKYFEITPYLLSMSNMNGYFIKLNKQWEKTLGYTIEELISNPLMNFIHPDDINPTLEVIEKQKGQKDVFNFINRYRRNDGTYRWIEWNSSPSGDTMYASARDITEIRIQEQKLRKLNRTLAMLSHVNEMIVRETDKQKIYDEICRIAVKDGDFLLSWIGEIDDNTKKVIPKAKFGSKTEYLDDLIITIDDEPTSKGPTGRSIMECRTVFCNDIEMADIMQPWRSKALKCGFRSSASFPIKIEDKVISCFTLYSDEANFFDHDEIRLLKDLCADIAYAIAYQKKEEIRKELEKKVQESEKRYKMIFDTTTEGLWIYDDNHLISMANNQMAIMLGYDEDKDLIGKKVTDFMDAEESADHKEKTRQRKHGNIASYERKLKRKDGSHIWVRGAGTPYLNEEHFQGYFSMFTEITDLKKAEDALIESKERLDLAIESGQTGVWELDLEKDTSIRNLRHDQIFGYTKPIKDWGQKKFLEHILQEDRKHVQKDFKRATETGIFKTECRIIWPDNSIHWIYASGRLELNIKTKSDKLIGTVIDITDRKNLEDKLNKNVVELERSNKELEQFAYVASHDLKEPLRMVSSYTQLLSERYKDKLDQDANDFIGFAVDGAMRMQSLINDLLSYSRVNTQGKVFREVNMQTKLGEVIALINKSITEKNALITNDNLPIINADDSQMQQLLQNLIGNALKFCNKMPLIYIGVQENKDEWLFSVKDNGIGIESQYKDKIFLIFQRLHNRSEYSGTGIGLAICKRIIEMHKGNIWFESEPGKGTTFFFTIPKKAEIQNHNLY